MNNAYFVCLFIKKRVCRKTSKPYLNEMIKRYVQLSIQRVWDIEGYPNYFFGDDKQLYRIDTRGVVKRNPRTMKRYTMGYTLKSRFFSLSQLRPLLRRHGTTDRPIAI